MTGWSRLAGGQAGPSYAARFAAMAAAGQDMHGEAAFCARLLTPPARVLDAGCGTGRVAIRLAALGFDCVGVDLDSSMLAEARSAAPGLNRSNATSHAGRVTEGCSTWPSRPAMSCRCSRLER